MDALWRTKTAAAEAWDSVFENAPVMMHHIDFDFRIVNVNAMWTKTTGYQRHELVGRSTVDFETEESRRHATANVLPQLLKGGSSQGVLRTFFTKDGSLLNLWMNLQACLSSRATTFGALYEPTDPIQQDQASRTMQLLLELSRLHLRSEVVWSTQLERTEITDGVTELLSATESPPEAEGRRKELGGGRLLHVDLEQNRVTVDGRYVHLTPREWAILRLLYKNAGTVVGPRQLLREARGPRNGGNPDYVRAYIMRLRKKLEPDPKKPRHILVERGIGYRLVLQN